MWASIPPLLCTQEPTPSTSAEGRHSGRVPTFLPSIRICPEGHGAHFTPAPSLRPEQGWGWASGTDGHSPFMMSSSEGINSIFGSPPSGLKFQGGKVWLSSNRHATLVDTKTLLDLGDIVLVFLEQEEWIPSGPNSCLLVQVTSFLFYFFQLQVHFISHWIKCKIMDLKQSFYWLNSRLTQLNGLKLWLIISIMMRTQIQEAQTNVT